MHYDKVAVTASGIRGAPVVPRRAAARRSLFPSGTLVPCAEELLKDGSRAGDLWGFNIYPDGHLDFVSLVNIRPANGNRTMAVQNPAIQARIQAIVTPFLP